MKINESDPVSRLQRLLSRLEEPERPGPAKESPRTGQTTRPVQGHDEIRVSLTAQELQKMRDEVAASPEQRQQLVDRLREEIASGRYRIDGTLIADKILGES